MKKSSWRMRVYELLGIKTFRKMVFELERMIHKKDRGRNVNYHIPHNDLQSLDDFVKYLFYNGSIHVRNIVGICAFFAVKGCIGFKVAWYDGIILTLLIKDIYCVMLQRYNYLRIMERKEILAEKNRKLIQAEVARIKFTSIENYSQESMRKDLQLVRRLRRAISDQRSIVLEDSDRETLYRLVRLYESRTPFKKRAMDEIS